MNEALKFRLVGAAVLLIGLGLLWPLLFDYDEAMQPEFVDLDMSKAEEAKARIEQREPVDKPRLSANKASTTSKANDAKADLADAAKERVAPANQVATSQPGEQQSSEKSASKASQPKVVATKPVDVKPASKSPAITEAQPQLDAQGIPIAYVVQLGTFSSWENADQLRNRLNEQGYRAYVRPETSVQHGPYRVQVGPVMTFALAQQLNGELKKELKMGDTFIRRFAQHATQFSTAGSVQAR